MNLNVTFSLAVFAAVMLSTTGHAQGKWKGAAISNSDSVHFAWGADESEALNNALRKCRNAARGNVCRDAPEKSISVESWWWLVVADCNGRKFLGGSQWNGDVALENAKGKAPTRLRNACFQNQELAGTVPPTYHGEGDVDSRPERPFDVLKREWRPTENWELTWKDASPSDRRRFVREVLGLRLDE